MESKSHAKLPEPLKGIFKEVKLVHLVSIVENLDENVCILREGNSVFNAV
jgi:hypothetical protein